MVVLDECAIFVECEVFALSVLHQCEVLGAIVERLLAQHSVVDEDLEVVPFLFKSLAVFLEDALQTVAHLLGDICGNLLHVAVALQIRTAYIQGNVR